MAPHDARRGDDVCLLLGCRVPVVLRERKEGGYEDNLKDFYIY